MLCSTYVVVLYVCMYVCMYVPRILYSVVGWDLHIRPFSVDEGGRWWFFVVDHVFAAI